MISHILNIHEVWSKIDKRLYATVDKHLRIEATLTSVLFNKTLVFDKALKNTPDMEEAETQLLSFEKGTKSPDDFPDALENCVRKAQFYFTADLQGWGKPLMHRHKRGGW